MVIEEQNKTLLQELIDGKMKKIILDLVKHKAVGVNRIPMEFFQEAWPKVGNDI